jgi:hypothetical protein
VHLPDDREMRRQLRDDGLGMVLSEHVLHEPSTFAEAGLHGEDEAIGREVGHRRLGVGEGVHEREIETAVEAKDGREPVFDEHLEPLVVRQPEVAMRDVDDLGVVLDRRLARRRKAPMDEARHRAAAEPHMQHAIEAPGQGGTEHRVLHVRQHQPLGVRELEDALVVELVETEPPLPRVLDDADVHAARGRLVNDAITLQPREQPSRPFCRVVVADPRVAHARPHRGAGLTRPRPSASTTGWRRSRATTRPSARA